MIVTFYGVRGSTPCQSADVARYGGNTSSAVITSPGEHPLLLDLGTGLRYFGETLPRGEPFRGTALLSHLHWDHIQGLPFFTPLLCHGAELTIHAPTQPDGGHPGDCLAATIGPPAFPIQLDEMPGTITVHRAKPEFSVGRYVVRSGDVPHNGAMSGYRVEAGDASIAYVCDHQQPANDHTVADSVVELCRGVGLLIHDAQYRPDEFARKTTWGHCTAEYAVTVAAACGARRLALFHHDPAHGDDEVDEMLAIAQALGADVGVDVFAAREGLAVEVGAS